MRVKNSEEARLVEGWAQAAHGGDVDAMGHLAATLKPTSPDAATALYIRAASKGNDGAMVDLGIMLRESGKLQLAVRASAPRCWKTA
ncbi:MAG TPA: hypothetical protein VL984_07295 [Acidimicrobiales bacterium]|nr:hypothetical protein [Acidimicrobiales bacterium]